MVQVMSAGDATVITLVCILVVAVPIILYIVCKLCCGCLNVWADHKSRRRHRSESLSTIKSSKASTTYVEEKLALVEGHSRLFREAGVRLDDYPFIADYVPAGVISTRDSASPASTSYEHNTTLDMSPHSSDPTSPDDSSNVSPHSPVVHFLPSRQGSLEGDTVIFIEDGEDVPLLPDSSTRETAPLLTTQPDSVLIDMQYLPSTNETSTLNYSDSVPLHDSVPLPNSSSVPLQDSSSVPLQDSSSVPLQDSSSVPLLDSHSDRLCKFHSDWPDPSGDDQSPIPSPDSGPSPDSPAPVESSQHPLVVLVDPQTVDLAEQPSFHEDYSNSATLCRDDLALPSTRSSSTSESSSDSSSSSVQSTSTSNNCSPNHSPIPVVVSADDSIPVLVDQRDLPTQNKPTSDEEDKAGFSSNLPPPRSSNLLQVQPPELTIKCDPPNMASSANRGDFSGDETDHSTVTSSSNNCSPALPISPVAAPIAEVSTEVPLIEKVEDQWLLEKSVPALQPNVDDSHFVPPTQQANSGKEPPTKQNIPEVPSAAGLTPLLQEELIPESPLVEKPCSKFTVEEPHINLPVVEVERKSEEQKNSLTGVEPDKALAGGEPSEVLSEDEPEEHVLVADPVKKLAVSKPGAELLEAESEIKLPIGKPNVSELEPEEILSEQKPNELLSGLPEVELGDDLAVAELDINVLEVKPEIELPVEKAEVMLSKDEPGEIPLNSTLNNMSSERNEKMDGVLSRVESNEELSGMERDVILSDEIAIDESREELDVAEPDADVFQVEPEREVPLEKPDVVLPKAEPDNLPLEFNSDSVSLEEESNEGVSQVKANAELSVLEPNIVPVEMSVPPEHLSTLPEEVQVSPEEVSVLPVLSEEVSVLPEEVSVPPEEVPVLSEEVPVLSEEVPVLSEEVPVLSEEVPVLPEEVPVSPEEVSVLSEELPVLSEEVPVPSEEVPVLSEEMPISPEEVPFEVVPGKTQPVMEPLAEVIEGAPDTQTFMEDSGTDQLRKSGNTDPLGEELFSCPSSVEAETSDGFAAQMPEEPVAQQPVAEEVSAEKPLVHDYQVEHVALEVGPVRQLPKEQQPKLTAFQYGPGDSSVSSAEYPADNLKSDEDGERSDRDIEPLIEMQHSQDCFVDFHLQGRAGDQTYPSQPSVDISSSEAEDAQCLLSSPVNAPLRDPSSVNEASPKDAGTDSLPKQSPELPLLSEPLTDQPFEVESLKPLEVMADFPPQFEQSPPQNLVPDQSMNYPEKPQLKECSEDLEHNLPDQSNPPLEIDSELAIQSDVPDDSEASIKSIENQNKLTNEQAACAPAAEHVLPKPDRQLSNKLADVSDDLRADVSVTKPQVARVKHLPTPDI